MVVSGLALEWTSERLFRQPPIRQAASRRKGGVDQSAMGAEDRQ